MDVSAPSPGPAAAPEPVAWGSALSPELRRLTEATLAHALEAVMAEGSPMAPFVVADAPDGRIVRRFPGDPDLAVVQARAHAAAVSTDRAAVAWDGWLVVSGVRQDAVVVHASERGQVGVVVAHRYRDTLEGTVVVGRPVVVGPADPVL